MAKKKDSRTKITVKGDIKARRDVIMGDQYNYAPPDIDVKDVTTPGEFAAKLAEIQAAIAALKGQPDLNAAQRRNIEAAEGQVAQAAAEAQQPEADGKSIQVTLTEAQETFELLSGSITAAAGLGVVLGNLIGLVLQVF